MDVVKKVEEKLKIIGEKNPQLDIFIEVFDNAVEMAEKVQKKIDEGRGGKLAGMVIAVKNNIAIRGRRLTCSSRMLENYISPYNATVIEKILREDGIIIGTTNMDEFAAGSDTTHSAFFKTKNPVDPSRVPGGSSGGSAAAVAAGMCDGALGTDTGGSIRCPAAFCGVAGFKPTYGAVSRYGLVDMAMSLDQIGPLANDVETLKKIFDVIKGPDEKDQATFHFKEVEKKVEKIGVAKEFFDFVDEEISEIIRKKIDELSSEYEIVDVSIPSIKYVVPIYYLVMSAEFSSAMQKYDGLRYGAACERGKELYSAISEVRGRFFGEEVKRRIILGTYITMKEYKGKWYSTTLKARRKLIAEFESAFEKCDIIAGPAMPCLPWKFGEKLDPVELYQTDVLTVSANLVGIPAGVVPIGKIGNLPVAIQFHGRKWEDKGVLNVIEKGSK